MLSDDNFDEFSAETLAAIDNELQQIKLALLQRFPQLDLSSVFPIGQVNYGMELAVVHGMAWHGMGWHGMDGMMRHTLSRSRTELHSFFLLFAYLRVVPDTALFFIGALRFSAALSPSPPISFAPTLKTLLN